MELGETQKCTTCFKGANRYVGGTYEWSRCDVCNARALNGAQLQDLGIMERGNGQALIGACMGSRKTGTTTAFINRHRGVWVGIVPLHTINQWVKAISEWSPGTEVRVINVKNKTGLIDLKESSPDTVHLIGWELARRQDWRMFKNIDGAFLDEVHRAAGFDTLTAKAIHRLNSTYRIALSGTPANNKLWGLWNALHWIWWGNNDHKTATRLRRYKVRMGDDVNPGWIRRHFRLIKKPMFHGRDSGYDIGAEINFHSVIDEVPTYIQHLEFETCCEHHPGGVNASLPPKLEPVVIYTDMTPAQAKIYASIDNGNAVMWLDQEEEDGRKGMYIGDADMVRRLRKRQVALAVPVINAEGKVMMSDDAKSSKIDAWLDLAEDIVQPGNPVLVFTHSKIFAKIVVARTNKRLGAGTAVEWSGDVKQSVRDTYKDETFGRPGGPSVIVAVIQSIAEGTDGLQDVCSQEVWLSWDDNMTLNTQCGGRLPRTGQERRTRRWDIVTKGTIEEKQIKSLTDRKTKLDAALRA